MRAIETSGVISDIIVVIEDFKYKGVTSILQVECSSPGFECLRAMCDDPYFVIGHSFWKEKFGAKMTRAIEKICERAVKKYKKEHNIE